MTTLATLTTLNPAFFLHTLILATLTTLNIYIYISITSNMAKMTNMAKLKGKMAPHGQHGHTM
jgi:hypothetical protein